MTHPPDLVLNDIRQNDLRAFGDMIAQAAAEIDAIARQLPDDGIDGKRFLLQQKVSALTGIAAGIREGLLAGKDAVHAMERGFDVYNRQRWTKEAANVA